jgi:hypothetical protein
MNEWTGSGQKALLTVLFGLLGSTAFAAWTPPSGIPAPTFGVNETLPPFPVSWGASSMTSGAFTFYYVCPSCAGATDSGNPNGYPGKPRASVPGTVAGNRVVVLDGQINTDLAFTASGSAAAPVFVTSRTPATPARLTGAVEGRGAYVIYDHLWFGPQNSGDSDFGFYVPEGAHHVALRNSELTGNLNLSGGVGLGSWGYTGGASASNVVIDNNYIHDLGNLSSASDEDAHCVTVNGSGDHLWVTNNRLERCSGDAIQIEAQAGRRAAIHHVYYGKNSAGFNRQSGGWVKNATDVIFSQNVAHDSTANSGGPGACYGFQYDAEQVWFLFNEGYRCNIGIAILGFETTAGQNAYIVGNLLHDIQAPTTNPYDAGAMVIRGGTNVSVVNNTMYNVDSGVNMPPGTKNIYYYNNIIANRLKANTYDLYTEGPVTTVDARNNIFGANARFTGTTKGTNAFLGDPAFTNPDALDFHLRVGSPAIDTGLVSSVYAAFQSRYGLTASVDFDGVSRPVRGGWDIGALEMNAFFPDIAIGDLTVSEGDSGLSPAFVTVTLNGPTIVPVLVNFSTANGTATGGVDFLPASATLVFPPGSVSAQIGVLIVGDRVYENAESFAVNLTSANWGTIVRSQGSVTITNDDAQGFSVNDVDVVERKTGTTTAPFVVTLSPTSSQAVTVDYSTSNGTATAGADYVAASGTLNFPAGAATASVPVVVNADALGEGVETFTLNLSNPTGGAAIAWPQGTARIYPAGVLFTVAPCRVLDTRNAAGPLGGPALGANTSRTFGIAGACGVPASATAVSLNVTVTQATAAGDLRVYPAGASLPSASVINYRSGITRANSMLAGLGSAGQIAIRCDQGSGSVHAIVDVTGYFQ